MPLCLFLYLQLIILLSPFVNFVPFVVNLL